MSNILESQLIQKLCIRAQKQVELDFCKWIERTFKPIDITKHLLVNLIEQSIICSRPVNRKYRWGMDEFNIEFSLPVTLGDNCVVVLKSMMSYDGKLITFDCPIKHWLAMNLSSLQKRAMAEHAIQAFTSLSNNFNGETNDPFILNESDMLAYLDMELEPKNVEMFRSFVEDVNRHRAFLTSKWPTLMSYTNIFLNLNNGIMEEHDMLVFKSNLPNLTKLLSCNTAYTNDYNYAD